MPLKGYNSHSVFTTFCFKKPNKKVVSFNKYQKLPVCTLQLSVIGPNKDDLSVKQGNSHSLIGAEQWFEIFFQTLHICQKSAVQVHILKNSTY